MHSAETLYEEEEEKQTSEVTVGATLLKGEQNYSESISGRAGELSGVATRHHVCMVALPCWWMSQRKRGKVGGEGREGRDEDRSSVSQNNMKKYMLGGHNTTLINWGVPHIGEPCLLNREKVGLMCCWENTDIQCTQVNWSILNVTMMELKTRTKVSLIYP